MASPTRRQILTLPVSVQAPALSAVRKAAENARSERPPQRGWICHTSRHYNTPGNILSTSPCTCGHTACLPVPMTIVHASRMYNFPSPPTCFDVVLTTRDDPNCSGWVCFFCHIYTAWLTPDAGIAALTCGNCGSVEENEVIFVERLAGSEEPDEDEYDEGDDRGDQEYGDEIDDQAEEALNHLKRRGRGGKGIKRPGYWSGFGTMPKPAW